MRTVFPLYVIIEHDDDPEVVNSRIGNLLEHGTVKDAFRSAGLNVIGLGTTGEYEEDTTLEDEPV